MSGKSKLKKELEKYELEDYDELLEEIENFESQLSKAKKKDDTKKIEKLERKLKDLNRLKDLYDDDKTEEDEERSENKYEENTTTDFNKCSSNNYNNYLQEDFNMLPSCAEKTIIEFILFYESKSSVNADKIVERLKYDLKKQKFLSETEINSQFQNLNRALQTGKSDSIISILRGMLKSIRPLNIREIQRLIKKTEEAAELIRNQNIIVLVGVTGSGKSTTIHFLSGSKMVKTQVEISPGKFLEHITASQILNEALKEVSMSPIAKSETRFIKPIVIPLKDVFRGSRQDSLILCDSPGFDDTAGPEVDIANGIGVIEALKGCQTVKLLVLSSFPSLGDRGQGIQKLAHILVTMIKDITKRFDSIQYAFTKYPDSLDINAKLTDVRNNALKENDGASKDSAFIALMDDMIEKTEEDPLKIDPLTSNRKEVIKKLQELKGIKYPNDVFQFSMSKETQNDIRRQIERDKANIICAFENEDMQLVVYYLQNLEILKNITKQSVVKDVFDESINFIIKSIHDQNKIAIDRFNISMDNKDGLKVEEIEIYKKAIEKSKCLEFLNKTIVSSNSVLQQKLRDGLKEHNFNSLDVLKQKINDIKNIPENEITTEQKHMLKELEELENNANFIANSNSTDNENIPSTSNILIQNIIIQLKNKRKTLETLDLNNLDVKIYLNNLHLLRQHFTELQQQETEDFEFFFRRFKDLVQETKKAIDENKFDVVAENLCIIFQLVSGMNETVETKANAYYNETVKYILRHVYEYFKKSEDTLQKLKLDEHDLSILKDSLDTLSSAKENSILQSHVKQFLNSISSGDINKLDHKQCKDLITTYNDLINSIMNYFDAIVKRIEENLRNNDYETAFNSEPDLKRLCELPEIQSKCASAFYNVQHSIRAHIQNFQKEAESLIFGIKNDSTNYKSLARSLKVLEKNAEWCDAKNPGSGQVMLSQIKEDLLARAETLKTNISRLDLGLKYPANVLIANDIVEQINSMSVLERFLPELKSYREEICEKLFISRVQGLFDSIQKKFDLQKNDIYQYKVHLINLQKVKQDYEELHEFRVFLKTSGYNDISEIEQNLKNIHDNIQKLESEKNKILKDIEKEIADGEIRIENFYAKKNADEKDAFLKSLGVSSVTGLIQLGQKKQNSLQANCAHIGNQIETEMIKKKEYENIKITYEEKLKETSINDEQSKLLEEQQVSSFKSLEEEISKYETIISKDRQTSKRFVFTESLDAQFADIALEYISSCEKVSVQQIRDFASDNIQLLQKYVEEYGNFIYKEIKEIFDTIKEVQNDSKDHSYELYSRLRELSAFNKYERVFQFANGKELVENWRQEFRNYLMRLTGDIEDSKNTGDSNLQKLINIAKNLSCVDQFFPEFQNSGFEKLYIKNKAELNIMSRQIYKDILELIWKHEFESVDWKINEIEDKPLNPRDEKQIKIDLASCLNKIMKETRSSANWLHGKIESENNKLEIVKICDNIEKITLVSKKDRLMQLCDEKLKENINKFEKEITDILSSVILKGLDSIQFFINTNNFFEAEKGIQALNDTQKQLMSYLSDEVNKRSNDLQEQLNTYIQTLLKDQYLDIKALSSNPPKYLLEKLKTVQERGNKKYEQVYNSVYDQVKAFLNQRIEELNTLSFQERLAKIPKLKTYQHYLPEDLKTEFISQLEGLKEEYETEKTQSEKETEKVINGIKNKEHSSETVKEFEIILENYAKRDLKDLSDSMKTRILKELEIEVKNAESDLDNGKINEALETLDKVSKYINLIEKANDLVKILKKKIINSVSSNFETISKIQILQNYNMLERSFDFITAFVNSPVSETVIDPKELEIKYQAAIDNFYKYFNEKNNNYLKALDDMDIKEIQKFLIQYQANESLVNKIKNTFEPNSQNYKEFSKIPEYKDLIKQVVEKIMKLELKLKEEPLMTNETQLFEKNRDELFQNLNKNISLIREINIHLKEIVKNEFDTNTLLNSCEDIVKKNIDSLLKKLLESAKKVDDNANECKKFRDSYQHVQSFSKYIKFYDVKTQLEDADAIINEQINKLRLESIEAIKNFSKLSEKLVKMKFLSENLIIFKDDINNKIDEVLKIFKEKNNSSDLPYLCMELEKTDTGARIISEHSALAGQDWRKRREKMQNQDNLDYVLHNLQGDNIDKEIIKSRFVTFRKKYDELLSSHLTSMRKNEQKEPNTEVLISEIKNMVGSYKQNKNLLKWSKSLSDTIPDLLAYIFALWTLQNTQHYNEAKGIDSSNAYLLMPHAAQVVSIFRVLGIGYESRMFQNLKQNLFGSKDLINNIVEIGTGEGKSVILAITACVFGLIGVDVSCSCYSEYLSKRDQKDFMPLFSSLGIDSKIKYGTFNDLSEQFLNDQCNLREIMRQIIINNKTNFEALNIKPYLNPRVLLIDEIDVFLSDRYYGAIYRPSFLLKDLLIENLLRFIWKEAKTKKASYSSVKSSQEYKACATKFSNWEFLIDEALKDILVAYQSYRSSTYVVKNDKICYVEEDSLLENVVYGYNTVWAYYHEHENGSISEKSLKNNVGIIINCGTFSYAEMPNEFSYITGVSGTLKTLTEYENKILQDTFKIEKKTFMPSVFGKCNRQFNETTDVIDVDSANYFMKLRGEIDVIRNAHRAILVFFESEEKLDKFYNSTEIADIKNDVQIITEKVSSADRELYIKKACTIGSVTFLTSVFGRGTDFICRNTQLLANGGVHVLQTFFTLEVSAEYQIMGRSARQGDNGSYRIVLLDSELEWLVGPEYKTKIDEIKKIGLYKGLNQLRIAKYESLGQAKRMNIDDCKSKHDASKNFMLAVKEGKIKDIQEFLKAQNKGAILSNGIARTLILMDATGSMSSLLEAVKNTICRMITRASEVLKEKGLCDDTFIMQCAVYRNYNCRENKILQTSAWETKGSNLQNFMMHLEPEGGWGEEAIEIGLWHAVEESNKEYGLSQVILIGDAPANSTLDVDQKRKRYGEDYWKKTKFHTPTYYETELNKLKEKRIPVHCFYLTSYAKNNFSEIAKQTKGRCEELNINSRDGAEVLTHLVTEEILRKAGGSKGDEAVELYRQKYVLKKSFT